MPEIDPVRAQQQINLSLEAMTAALATRGQTAIDHYNARVDQLKRDGIKRVNCAVYQFLISRLIALQIQGNEKQGEKYLCALEALFQYKQSELLKEMESSDSEENPYLTIPDISHLLS